MGEIVLTLVFVLASIFLPYKLGKHGKKIKFLNRIFDLSEYGEGIIANWVTGFIILLLSSMALTLIILIICIFYGISCLVLG